jgi:HK97 gp10 family phage protein
VFDHLPQLKGELRDHASAAIRKAAFDIEAGAKVRAPYRTGFLRNSIQATMTGVLSAVVAVGAHYGIYLEYGTYKMAPRPYLTPAVEAVRPGLVAAMKQLF